MDKLNEYLGKWLPILEVPLMSALVTVLELQLEHYAMAVMFGALCVFRLAVNIFTCEDDA